MSVHRVNSDNTGWPESIINCAHIPSAGFVGLLCQSYAKEVLGGLGWGGRISAARGAAILPRSLPMKSRERFVGDVFQ